ncbi:MAG: hypothetical protein ACXVWF_01250 [Actinomycetota bacterium]
MSARTKAGRFAVAAFVAAVAGALYAAFGPIYGGCEASMPGGQSSCGSATGLAVNGSWILVVVSVPVVLALVPVLLRYRPVRVVSAVLLWACCVVGALSIGMFFLPAAILMTIAAAKREPMPVPPIPTG